jgi:hypothetical protein
MKKQEPIFPKGIYYKTNSYDWIDFTMSINVEDFTEWMKSLGEDNIHIQVLTSKAGKKYFKYYSFADNKPKQKGTSPEQQKFDSDFWD